MRKIPVKVIPGAGHTALQEDQNGNFIARLTQRAESGKANAALIELLSKHFNCSKSSIIILKGIKSRSKLVGILHD